MARYSHLPLFIKVYGFVQSVYRMTRQFRREYKYSLGAEMEKLIWQVLDEIVRANSLRDKTESIGKISLFFDHFKIRFRFAFDSGLVNRIKFAQAQKDLEEIGKMIGGWQAWSQNQVIRNNRQNYDDK